MWTSCREDGEDIRAVRLRQQYGPARRVAEAPFIIVPGVYARVVCRHHYLFTHQSEMVEQHYCCLILFWSVIRTIILFCGGWTAFTRLRTIQAVALVLFQVK